MPLSRARATSYRHRFVINRVTAATMEPRGAVGDYNAADGRYTIHTPAAATASRPRTELAKVLKVPESKIRIVTGDTGGSFGMKTPIFNEIPLVLLASKLTGRPVKWISTRTEAFPVRRAGARQCHRSRARARQATVISSRCA